MYADGRWVLLDRDVRQLQKQPQKLTHMQKWRIYFPWEIQTQFKNTHTINLHLNSHHVKCF